MIHRDENAPYDTDQIFGTALVKVNRNVQFGYRVEVYLELMNIAGADVLASYMGDLFTIPNISKSTFKVMVDRLADHPATPMFKFRPRGVVRWER